MIALLVLLQSALPPATSESTNPETHTDRFEFSWEWSSENRETQDTRSEIERQNEDRAGRTGGWVETAPGVYEFRATEQAGDQENEWRPSQVRFGPCATDDPVERARLAAIIGVEDPDCGQPAHEPATGNPDLGDDGEEDDTPRWDGRVQLAPANPDDPGD